MRLRNWLPTVLMFLISPYLVFAKNDYMPEIMKDFLKWLFMTLPENARASDDAFVIYFKFMLWILVYAIIYYGSKKVFHDSNRIAGTVSFIISLAGVMLIPDEILLFIFKEFSSVIAVLLGLLPVLIGLYVRHKIPAEHRLMRTVVLILIGLVALLFGTYMVGYAENASGTDAELYGDVGQWASLGGVVALFMGVFGFLTGFGKGGTGGGSGWGRGTSAPASKEVTHDANRVKDDTNKALGLTKKEQDYTNNLIRADVNSMKDDTEIRQHLEEIREFIRKYLAAFLSFGGVNYAEYRRRKLIVIPKLRQVREAIRNREERDKKLKEMIDGNKKLLRALNRWLKKEKGATKREVEDSLKEKIKDETAVKKYMKELKEAQDASKVGKVENVLEKDIIDREKKRDELLRKVEEHINKSLEEMNQIEPTVPRMWKSREPFKKAISEIDSAISELNSVVAVDKKLEELEQNLYKYDEFLKRLELDTGATAAAGP